MKPLNTKFAIIGVILISFLLFAACDDEPADRTITQRIIGGITSPSTGGTPTPPVGGFNPLTPQYKAEVVSWSPVVPASAGFEAGRVYTLTLELTAEPGWTFRGLPADHFRVNGIESSHDQGTDERTLTVTIVFPATQGPNQGTPINLKNITLARPVEGRNPAATITETEQFTGTIVWVDNTGAVMGQTATFTKGLQYTAVISLTAKSGFSTAVPANFFEVLGATTTSNLANSGTVYAIFSALALPPVTLSAIPGIVRPVTGINATPAHNTTNRLVPEAAPHQYTIDVRWSPPPPGVGNNEPFAANTLYSVELIVRARDEFTLVGLPENFFTIADAATTSTVTGHLVGSVFTITDNDPLLINPESNDPRPVIIVTAIFPRTGAAPAGSSP
ncbi:MAG: hypothetical protein FWG77_11560 [Treponema sp.]|nr:hypothetical protein [Treponema sp.]